MSACLVCSFISRRDQRPYVHTACTNGGALSGKCTRLIGSTPVKPDSAVRMLADETAAPPWTSHIHWCDVGAMTGFITSRSHFRYNKVEPETRAEGPYARYAYNVPNTTRSVPNYGHPRVGPWLDLPPERDTRVSTAQVVRPPAVRPPVVTGPTQSNDKDPVHRRSQGSNR